MGLTLTDQDEYNHPVGGAEANWNESRYIDFWDSRQRVGGWFRTGMRPNAKYSEMSAGINLPDGRYAFMFGTPRIEEIGYRAGDLAWHVDVPWKTTRLEYHGELMILEDGWRLTDPKKCFNEAPRLHADISLTVQSFGLESVMGKDQDHIDLIFVPGMANFHYNHLIRTTGTVKVGDQQWTVDGRGGKDHSWGPRNWHAKLHYRWLIAAFDDDFGFILSRAVSPTKNTRSGFVWDKGEFLLVDDFEMHNTFADAPRYELRQARVCIRSGDRQWTATGTPQHWLPLRHRHKNAQGEEATNRIVKSPAEWVDDAGRTGEGMLEYHDMMNAGIPHGIDD